MFLFGITVLAAVIIIGGVIWTLFNNNNQPAPTQNSHSNGTSPESGDQNPESIPSDTTPELPSTTPTSPSSDSNGTPNASSSTDLLSPEQIRDAIMANVKAKHPETAPLMTNMTWTGGRADFLSIDNETYLYYGSEWKVKVEFPVASVFTYSITGDYHSETLYIAFTATYKNGIVSITNYSSQIPQP